MWIVVVVQWWGEVANLYDPRNIYIPPGPLLSCGQTDRLRKCCHGDRQFTWLSGVLVSKRNVPVTFLWYVSRWVPLFVTRFKWDDNEGCCDHTHTVTRTSHYIWGLYGQVMPISLANRSAANIILIPFTGIGIPGYLIGTLHRNPRLLIRALVRSRELRFPGR